MRGRPVIIATDGSESAEQAVVAGARVARTLATKAVLVYVRPSIPDDLRSQTDRRRRHRASVLVRDGAVAGASRSKIRSVLSARDAVDRLHELGLRVALVTRDRSPTPSPPSSRSTRSSPRCCRRTRSGTSASWSGVILAWDDPLGVVSVIEVSRGSYRKMLQNLGWAVGYNVVAIPLAAGVLAPWGITLAPAVGAVLTSLSTMIVALNAQLLRRLDLSP